jgi:hypothetical protein
MGNSEESLFIRPTAHREPVALGRFDRHPVALGVLADESARRVRTQRHKPVLLGAL